VILEYGDYECPYSRKAFRQVQRVESRLGSEVRFAFAISRCDAVEVYGRGSVCGAPSAPLASAG